MAKDYYATLGISKSASAEDIKAAYKKQAKLHHPDLNKGNKQSEEKFKEINEAYSVLGDEKKKAQYDRFGEVPPQGQGYSQGFEGFQGFGGEGFEFNFDDLFGEFFGGGRGRRQRGRGEDITIQVHLTLEEAAAGKRQKVNIDRMTQCSHCKGTGAESGKRTTCPTCKGSGGMRRQQRTPFGVMQTIVTCDTCQGLGSMAEKACKFCKGIGRQEEEQTISVDIPAGVGDDMQLRVSGGGNAGAAGQQPGDLIVLISVEEHELFTREGDDLHVLSTITYPQAVLGTTLEVPTLTGSVKLAIPEGTESGTVFRARGKGMPHVRGGSGDLLVTVKIAVPRHVSAKEREIIEKLAGTEKHKGFFERFKL